MKVSNLIKTEDENSYLVNKQYCT